MVGGGLVNYTAVFMVVMLCHASGQMAMNFIIRKKFVQPGHKAGIPEVYNSPQDMRDFFIDDQIAAAHVVMGKYNIGRRKIGPEVFQINLSAAVFQQGVPAGALVKVFFSEKIPVFRSRVFDDTFDSVQFCQKIGDIVSKQIFLFCGKIFITGVIFGFSPDIITYFAFDCFMKGKRVGNAVITVDLCCFAALFCRQIFLQDF